MSAASISGWITVALMVVAAALPLGYRLRESKRAAPDSSLAQKHVIVGLTVAGIAFAHTLAALFSLGSSSAIAAGTSVLALGAVAFMALIAHTGIGLQLKDPKLRKRSEKRRTHAITATLISVAAIAHAALLLTAEG